MGSGMYVRKVDKYTGVDKNGVLHNIEVHKSGVKSETWICGYCGKPLKGEPHFVGALKGYRYCNPCFNQGKQLNDMPDYTERVLGRKI